MQVKEREVGKEGEEREDEGMVGRTRRRERSEGQREGESEMGNTERRGHQQRRKGWRGGKTRRERGHREGGDREVRHGNGGKEQGWWVLGSHAGLGLGAHAYPVHS